MCVALFTGQSIWIQVLVGQGHVLEPDTILQELELLISGLLLTRSGGLFWIYSFKLEGGACPLFCSEIEFSGRVVAGVLFCRV